jgi:hypothetical protein
MVMPMASWFLYWWRSPWAFKVLARVKQKSILGFIEVIFVQQRDSGNSFIVWKIISVPRRNLTFSVK